jgi:hypothetical protein
MAKGKKKRSAKRAKRKRGPHKAPPKKQLRFQAPGLPRAIEDLGAEAERYHRPWTTQKLVEGRALLDRIIKREMFGPEAAAANPVAGDLAATEAADTAAITATKRRGQPAQERCWRAFDRFFPDGCMPDEGELSTEALREDVAIDLASEAKKAEKKPPPSPAWDTVKSARLSWRRKR